MEARIVGHHGSTKSMCDEIIKNRKFKPSRNTENLYNSIISGNNTYHWLGEGIYFWDNNEERAKYWADGIAKKNNDEMQVLEVSIRYEHDRIFDIRKKEYYKIIKEIVSRLIIQFNDKINFENLPRNDKYKFIGFACDNLYEREMPYDLIYGEFKIEEKDEFGKFYPEMTPQICVKDDKVIEYDSIKMLY